MHRLLYPLAAAAALALAAPALADSPFDGTWKGDVAAAKVSAKPDEFLLKDGSYTCATCLPPLTVRADGKFHEVAGRDYYDAVAVTVVDPRTVRTELRRAGKVIATNTRTVSPDGGTLTMAMRETNNAAGAPVEATMTQTRAAPAPAGAHAMSGKWAAAPASQISDTGITMTLRVENDTLHLSSPLGETLTARLGGDYAPNVGDPGKTMTKAERVGDRAIRLTDMRGGKVVQVATWTVAPDGQSITGEWQDPRNGSTGSVVARKQ